MSETFEGVKFIDLPPIKYSYAQTEYTACFEKPAIRDWKKPSMDSRQKTTMSIPCM